MPITPRSLCLAAAASLLIAAAPAHALTLEFSGQGVVNGPAQTPPFFSELSIQPPDATYTFGGEAGWTISVAFGGVLTPEGGYEGNMLGDFNGPVAGDSLSFYGTQFAAVLGQPIELTYTILGGTGAWAGYTGSGTSTVTLMGNPFGLPTPVPFMEVGVLNLVPVPEPGTWALWMAGLAALAARGRQRARRRLPAAGACSGLLALAATAAAPVASAQVVQYTYSGNYSASDPFGRTSGSISSSRGDLPYGQAEVGRAGMTVFATFAPVASVQASAWSSPSGATFGSLSFSYSVMYTPNNSASLQFATDWAAAGLPFGDVRGRVEAAADGLANASARAKSEAGGFGAGESPFSDEYRLDCGVYLQIVGPSNNAECRADTFDLRLFLKPLPNSVSFVGKISLFASVSTGGFGNASDPAGTAYAFVDPLITLDPRLSGDLVIGGGAVANAVPEPGTSALLASGLAAVVGVARRRRA